MEPADKLFENNSTNTKKMVYRFLKLHYCPAKTASGIVVDESNSPHH